MRDICRQPARSSPQLVLVDLAAATLASLAAFVMRFGVAAHAVAVSNVAIAALLPVAWVAGAGLRRAYDPRFAGIGGAEFVRTFRTFVDLTVLGALISYVAHLNVARGFLLAAMPLTLILSWTGRYVARLRLQRLQRAGIAMNRVLAVGSAESVHTLAIAMKGDVYAGLHVVGACLPKHEAADPDVRRRLIAAGISEIGDLHSVGRSVELCEARSVAVMAAEIGPHLVRSISWELERTGIDLIVSSGLADVARQRVHVQTIAGQPLLRVDEPRHAGFRPMIKGAFDRSAAAFALILLAPVLLVVAVLVRCTSRGPVFYRQTRVGRNGNPFRMVKFRSMRVGADAEVGALAHRNEASDGLLFKIREDPRVTSVGRVLRRFSADELPQLFNVLTGSMSLVGPRPPLPAEVERYGADVRRRLLVKPGLTGLWQVSGRSDLSWEEAVRLDLHYVENWSFALDMILLCKTARVVVKATGAY